MCNGRNEIAAQPIATAERGSPRLGRKAYTIEQL
jgi:hypothetical protein